METVLRSLPVERNFAVDALEMKNGAPDQKEGKSKLFKSLIRSKGYTWVANQHATALFWSHAGSSFELRDEGSWWAATPRGDWPTAPKQVHTVDYSNPPFAHIKLPSADKIV